MDIIVKSGDVEVQILNIRQEDPSATCAQSSLRELIADSVKAAADKIAAIVAVEQGTVTPNP